MKSRGPLAGLVWLLLAGCTGNWREHVPADARAALENPDRMTLLTLLPSPPAEARALDATEGEFRGFVVLGHVELDDLEIAAELVGLLREGVDGSSGTMALCFSPRHGIAVTSGAEEVALVACFECLQLRVHLGEGPPRTVAISRSVEPAVSRLYRAAGLAIHGDPGR